ncbi:coiled-coil domain-containing protein mad1 [Dimargaris verticillata]|uniref:Spindle assembly checkpoint component MAD1 n=1 Tax=Dimargaris verticillata TaxID=2761393 RepID=A0A9W8E913_9FUNG|nr:coiled-coil domain-containing protein mad1 [Dimargaris verticillata]
MGTPGPAPRRLAASMRSTAHAQTPQLTDQRLVNPQLTSGQTMRVSAQATPRGQIRWPAGSNTTTRRPRTPAANVNTNPRDTLPPSLREIRTGFRQFLDDDLPPTTTKRHLADPLPSTTTAKRRFIPGTDLLAEEAPTFGLHTPAQLPTPSLVASPLGDLMATPASADDAELRDLRRQLNKAKYEASRARSELEREQISHESQRQDWEKTTKDQSSRIEKLEKDRRFLFDKEKESAERCLQLDQQIQDLKDSYNDQIRHLKRQLQDLQDPATPALALRPSSTMADGLAARIDQYKHSVVQLQDQLANKTQRTEQLLATLAEHQQQLNCANQRVAELEAQGEQQQGLASISGELRHQVSYIKDLEAKIRRLQREVEDYEQRHENYELLFETKRKLERQNQAIEPLQNQVAQLQTENKALLEEKEGWFVSLRQVLLDVDGDVPEGAPKTAMSPAKMSPQRLAQIITQQRQQIATLHDQLGTLQAATGGTRVEHDNLQQQLEAVQARVAHLEQQHSRDKRLLQRLEKLRSLAQREVEFLREQLKSYDMEEMTLTTGAFDTAKAQRIQGLEDLVQDYRTQVQRLAGQLAARSSTEPTPNAPLPTETSKSAPLAQVEQLQQQVARLTHKLEAQDQEMALLERAVGRGDYNPRTTQVLQLAQNPTTDAFAIRETTLKALQDENRELLRQLQHGAATELLSQGSPSAVTGVQIPQQTVDNLLRDNAGLHAELAQRDKRLARLKEVWQAKAQEMREAIYSLLGYRLDFLENGRVRLVSMYSAAEDHSFIFTSNQHDSGTLELAGGGNTDYVKSLKSLIQFWVVERRSIPAFLATVTLELFDKTTAMMPPDSQTGWRGREEIDDTVSLAPVNPALYTAL